MKSSLITVYAVIFAVGTIVGTTANAAAVRRELVFDSSPPSTTRWTAKMRALSSQNKRRTMVDVKTGQKIVSVVGETTARKANSNVDVTVNALLTYEDGIAGQVHYDYEDGSSCNVLSDPSTGTVAFISGKKKIQIEITDGGTALYLMDDEIKDDDEVVVKTSMSFALIAELVNDATGVGLLHPDIETVTQCVHNYLTLYSAEASDERGLYDWVSGVVYSLIPSAGGCGGLFDAAMVALQLAVGCRGVYASGLACYTLGIAPAVLLLSTALVPAIIAALPSLMMSFTTNCLVSGLPEVADCINNIRSSCLYAEADIDERSLEGSSTLALP